MLVIIAALAALAMSAVRMRRSGRRSR